jgi:alcohol dehydrogenase class IV
VLDAGKSISAMLPAPGTIADYLEGAANFIPHPGTRIPFIAVPTTAGTGSEATKNAVISEVGISGFKRSLRHDNFMPKVALVDPELSQTCPKAVTAYTGMDALTQLLESFVSIQANPLSDAFAVSGLKHMAGSLERAFDDGHNIMARSGMSYAALCSGICLANAGLGTVHGFASSVGGRYNIPHGLICGTLLATVTEKTIGKLQTMDEDSDAIEKYAEAGQILHNSNNRSNEFYLDFLVDELHRLTARFEIPKLSQYGFDDSEITIIAKKTSCKNNPVQQTVDELMEILEERI